MNRIGLRELLVNTLGAGIDVYPDYVPEGQNVPAVAYTHISNGSTRTVKGNSVGNYDTWRISVVGNSRAECDTVVTTLKNLDNTKDDNFQNVFVLFDGDVPVSPDDAFRYSFVDIKTYG